MVKAAEIKDQETLELCLEKKPREVAVWIAARSAARVLPIWWHAVLAEEWARNGGFTALPVLRNLLISLVAARTQSQKVRYAAFAAHDAVGATTAAIAHASESAVAAAKAAHATVTFTPSPGDVPTTLASAVMRVATHSSRATADNVWIDIQQDATEFVKVGALGDIPLCSKKQPKVLREFWSEIKAQVLQTDDAGTWAFWIDWYQALLDGRPMLGDPKRTEEMLERIALIDPFVWDKGPEAANPVIDGIYQRYMLLVEAERLKAELSEASAEIASLKQRSHNQPPGLVEEQAQAAKQIDAVTDDVAAAADELEKTQPDRRRLKSISMRLQLAAKALVKYCAKVGDKVIITGAGTFGAAGGTFLADKFFNDGRVMEFASKLFQYATGG